MAQLLYSQKRSPASTADTYIHYLGQAVIQNLTDVNGTEFILDVDADTSLTADTDDQIDIKVGGTDRSSIKTTGFHNIDSFKFVIVQVTIYKFIMMAQTLSLPTQLVFKNCHRNKWDQFCHNKVTQQVR